MSSGIRKVLGLVLTLAVFGLSLRADSRTPFEADAVAEWAGTYGYHRTNSTMSLSLVISPEGRFTAFMGGCFGNFEVNHGSVAYRDAMLLLDPKLPIERGFTWESPAMIPVRFRGRVYLVGADRASEFANAIHSDSGKCRNSCQDFFVRDDLELSAEARAYSPSAWR
jgi:hypothetical protein